MYRPAFEQSVGNPFNVVGFGGQTTVIEYAVAVEHPLLSDTVTVKLKVPEAVGVPEIVPADDIDKPEGNVPLVTAKVGVPKAHVCVNDVDYADQAAPTLSAPEEVIVKVGHTKGV